MRRQSHYLHLYATGLATLLLLAKTELRDLRFPLRRESTRSHSVHLATVRITSKEGYGSGIILKQLANHHVLIASAAHIINEDEDYACLTYANKWRSLGKVIRLPKGNDIDLIFIVARSTQRAVFDYLTMRRSSSTNEVIAAGYPADSKVYRSSPGVIAERLLIPLAGGYGIASTSSISKGMSGGGLYFQNGELAGMVATHADPLWDADLRRIDGSLVSNEEKLRLQKHSLAVPLEIIKEKVRQVRITIDKQPEEKPRAAMTNNVPDCE
jgi:S1-C subfamily serine protease